MDFVCENNIEFGGQRQNAASECVLWASYSNPKARVFEK